MSLSETLRLIPKNDTVAALNKMFGENNKNVSVSISWSGQRLVSINGLGEVDLNQIVRKYLQAQPLREDRYNLKERLEFYDFWEKIEMLCKDDRRLKQTYLCKYLVLIKETCCWNTRARIINADDEVSKFPGRNDYCFSFYPKDFDKLWPGSLEKGEGYMYHSIDGATCVATWKMVAEAYAREMTRKK